MQLLDSLDPLDHRRVVEPGAPAHLRPGEQAERLPLAQVADRHPDAFGELVDGQARRLGLGLVALGQVRYNLDGNFRNGFDRGEVGPLKQIVVLALCALAPAATAHAQTYGDLSFPEDEHEHPDGWNFWWGAADVMTASGNRYTVGVAFDSLNGVGLTGHQVLPQQGPYKGLAINTMDGPEEWGHDPQTPGRFVTKMSNYVPGTSTPLVGTTSTWPTAARRSAAGSARRWSASRTGCGSTTTRRRCTRSATT